jgi:hypothetical protein
MNLIAIYEIRCPNEHAIELPETILEGIIRHLQWSYTDEPVLNFVCSECKTAFHFDYQNTEPAGWTDAPRRIEEFRIMSVQTPCDGSNCDDHVLLVAVRNLAMSEESIHEEKNTWNISGVTCKSRNHALPMGTLKWTSI